METHNFHGDFAAGVRLNAVISRLPCFGTTFALF